MWDDLTVGQYKIRSRFHNKVSRQLQIWFKNATLAAQLFEVGLEDNHSDEDEDDNDDDSALSADSEGKTNDNEPATDPINDTMETDYEKA